VRPMAEVSEGGMTGEGDQSMQEPAPEEAAAD
jgi:hypothetical protein